MLNTLFGNETVARILLFIESYGEGTTSGIARTFEMNKTRVYQQLLKLEEGGVLVARTQDNLRVFSINPRLLYRAELKSLLRKNLDHLPRTEFDRYFGGRRRPRRTGKAL